MPSLKKKLKQSLLWVMKTDTLKRKDWKSPNLFIKEISKAFSVLMYSWVSTLHLMISFTFFITCNSDKNERVILIVFCFLFSYFLFIHSPLYFTTSSLQPITIRHFSSSIIFSNHPHTIIVVTLTYGIVVFLLVSFAIRSAPLYINIISFSLFLTVLS